MSAKDKILRKLNFMQRCIGYLKSVDTDSTNLDMNYGLRSAVERNFQLAIESAIDIGEIVISEEGFERPQDYRSVFLILGRNSIIPKDFAEDFSLAAGFRNVLVHIYEEVDSSLLDVFLTERLDDFDEFARHIATYISNNS